MPKMCGLPGWSVKSKLVSRGNGLSDSLKTGVTVYMAYG